MGKLAVFSALIAVFCLMSSPAEAIYARPTSAALCLGDPPYRAGDLFIYFSRSDISDLSAHFGAGYQFILLRFTLSGTNLPPGVRPVLSAGIAGDPAHDLNFTNPVASWPDVVDLEEVGGEVSDYENGGDADLTAYLQGTAGSQYFEVIVTAFDPDLLIPATFGPDVYQWPYIHVGLDASDPGVTITDMESHPLIVDLPRFTAASVLEASMDTWPNTLTEPPTDDEIAHFDTTRITVNTAGPGSGYVTSDPSGIACPTDCSACVDILYTYTLTAVPTPGAVFRGWPGDCTGNDDCALNALEPRSVTALFAEENPGGCIFGIFDE